MKQPLFNKIDWHRTIGHVPKDWQIAEVFTMFNKIYCNDWSITVNTCYKFYISPNKTEIILSEIQHGFRKG